MIGNISSTGGISFPLCVEGIDRDYVFILTTEELNREGWIELNETVTIPIYQESIKPYSYKLIDLDNMTLDTSRALKTINIRFQPSNCREPSISCRSE